MFSGANERRNSRGSNEVLNSLNPQKFTSQIPSISNNVHKSMQPGSGLSNMINQSIARNARPMGVRNSGDRKSLRRSMRSSQRASVLPGSLGPTYSGSQQTRDPRPLRDKNYQMALQQDIYEYLQSQKFDVETGHPISLKSIRQPTQKDFIYIFRWLYQRLDPGYAFKKSLESEVYSILKTVQYPYLDTINKSQISAVGGSNWHKFLGMLHWLVNTNRRLDVCLQKVDESRTVKITQDITILNQAAATLDEQEEKHEQYELMVERLFIEYISKCYRSFINMEDDFAPFRHELENGFERFVHIIQTDIENMARSEERLKREHSNLEKRCEALKLARNKQKALQGDLNKFQKYINAMELKAHDWPRKLGQIEEEISEKRQLIKDTQNEINKLQNNISSEDVSNIDSMNRQLESISKDLVATSTNVDSLTSSVRGQKVAVDSTYKSFLVILEKYKASVNGFVLARNQLGHNVDGNPLAIDISPDLELSDNVEITPKTVLKNFDGILTTTKPTLLALNQSIQSRIKLLQRDNSTLESDLHKLRDEINSKNQLLETLENDLSNVKSEYDEYQQVSHSKLLSQRIEIEKLERKIQNDRNRSQQRESEAKQQIEEAKFNLKELSLNTQQEKLNLHKKVLKLIDFVVNFKMDIQGSIEELHKLTVEQLRAI